MADGDWPIPPAPGFGRGKTRRLAHTFCRRFLSLFLFFNVCVSRSICRWFASLIRILPLCFEYQLMCIRGARGWVYSSISHQSPVKEQINQRTCTSERASEMEMEMELTRAPVKLKIKGPSNLQIPACTVGTCTKRQIGEASLCWRELLLLGR